MEQRLFRKELVFGVVVLLIAICIIPSISGNLKNNPAQIEIEKNKESELVLVDPPGIEWFQSYGGSEPDYAWSVKQTNDGGYIFTGDTKSYGEYGTTDAWLCKTDAYGNVLWNYAFGKPGFENMDVGQDVILTSDGGYAFTGQTWSYNVEIESWLVKTDENGIEEWNITYGPGRGYSLHQTQDDGYIIGGRNGENSGALLLRTDSNGNEIWRNTFWGNPGDRATGWSVDATLDGGFVLTGVLYYADDDIEWDFFLIKTDADGVELINTTFGGPLNLARGESVQQTADGGFVLSGFIKYGDGNLNAWLIKTDAFGNEEWNQTFNEPLNYGDYLANDCKQTQDGGYVLVGSKDPYSGLMDSFLIKTDSNGEKEWELTLEGPETSDEHICSVDLTQDGGFIAVGLEGYFADAFLIKIGHIVDISINKPEDALYFLNSKIRNFQYRNPLIIGPVTVEVDASDDEYEIDHVEFYVDEQLMETDTTMPYSWKWNKLSFFVHTLKVAAYNSNGNVGIEEKTVWKFF